MKRLCAVLALCLCLNGCGVAAVAETAVQTLPPATVPADGTPGEVTSKGSYTGEVDPDSLVAHAGNGSLTNGQLQVWYWAAVAAYRDQPNGPDFSQPLDVQPCGVDPSVNSWQQFFLREALHNWHTAQALMAQGEAEGVPTEEAYKPGKGNYEKYMDGKPAAQFLYGYHDSYQPNTLHQAYLDGIPNQLNAEAVRKGYADAQAYARQEFSASQEDLERFMADYNRGYMYFTTLSYYCEPTQEELAQFQATVAPEAGDDTVLVTFRHILLEDSAQAETMLREWGENRRVTEGTFADLAHKNSLDEFTAQIGGLYQNIHSGQILPELEGWLFDIGREPGDTGILMSSQGCHILYFSGRTTQGAVRAEEEFHRQYQRSLLETAREQYPLRVIYSRIALEDAQGTVSAEELLYPDVAHERFPEVPLYLQQDYPGTRYNGSDVTKSGCGITTMAMLASYMTDEELTVPELCVRYAQYGGAKGTNGALFVNEPPELGFFLIEKLYDHRDVKPYLEQGYMIVVVQYKGFWTRGGHYLLLEKIDSEGVQVRDSNLFNYMRLKEHKADRFPWDCITPQGKGYWIFDKKVTAIPACTRCGTGSGMAEDYLCSKCCTALLRRNTYLNG